MMAAGCRPGEAPVRPATEPTMVFALLLREFRSRNGSGTGPQTSQNHGFKPSASAVGTVERCRGEAPVRLAVFVCASPEDEWIADLEAGAADKADRDRDYLNAETDRLEDEPSTGETV